MSCQYPTAADASGGTAPFKRSFFGWALEAGRSLNSDAVDVFRGALSFDRATGRRAMRLLLTAAQESAAGVALLSSDRRTQAAWQELRNKIEAFRSFEHADAVLAAPMHAPFAELVALAVRLPPPLSVWTLEGVGYHTAAAQLRRVGGMRDTVSGAADVLSPQTMIPLHAGMGSAFAAHALDGVRDVHDIDHAIARFQWLCEDNADPAYFGVTLESFGFSARGMFAELLPVIDTRLKAARPRLRGFFWHGAGRAAYFGPSAAFPFAGSPNRHLHDIASVAERPLDRVNAVAGFAWAVTLVNLRHPFVLELFLEKLDTGLMTEAFSIGVAAALEVWRRCAPHDGSIRIFESYVPDSPSRADRWRQVIGSADVRKPPCPGELFHVTNAEVFARPRAT